MTTTHACEVFEVKLRTHPNADALSIVNFMAYPSAVRTVDWKDGELGVFVPPDSLVPVARPEFAFLADEAKEGYARIRAKKLRGYPSYGLVCHAPEGARVGEDLAEYLGVKHWEPPQDFSQATQGDAESVPWNDTPAYDLEPLQRYPDLIHNGEEVAITEKIHGTQFKVRWFPTKEGKYRLWVGSHNQWKLNDPRSAYWNAVRANPAIEAFCREYPGAIVIGEAYGTQKGYSYGVPNGKILPIVFDVMLPNGDYAMYDYRYNGYAEKMPWVPTLYRGPFFFNKAIDLAEGPSTMPGANHIREGCVIVPTERLWHPAVGYLKLKVVGLGYLANKKG